MPTYFSSAGLSQQGDHHQDKGRNSNYFLLLLRARVKPRLTSVVTMIWGKLQLSSAAAWIREKHQTIFYC
jgi:hypothetical protein